MAERPRRSRAQPEGPGKEVAPDLQRAFESPPRDARTGAGEEEPSQAAGAERRRGGDEDNEAQMRIDRQLDEEPRPLDSRAGKKREPIQMGPEEGHRMSKDLVKDPDDQTYPKNPQADRDFFGAEQGKKERTR